VAVVIIVFGWLLPSLGVDYGEVWDAIQTLTGSQMAILLVLGLGRIVLEGAALLPVVPGINLWQATVAWSTSTGVANVIPGPWDLPLRYSCYVSWGVSPHNALLSFPLGGVFTLIIKLSLPVIAVVLLLIDGKTDWWVILLAAIGLVAMVVIIVVFVGIVRSERFAAKLGQLSNQAIGWLSDRLKRDRPEDVEEKLLKFRADGLDPQYRVGMGIAGDTRRLRHAVRDPAGLASLHGHHEPADRLGGGVRRVRIGDADHHDPDHSGRRWRRRVLLHCPVHSDRR
jgi:hypothetical protein